jgi:hypothetical protein
MAKDLRTFLKQVAAALPDDLYKVDRQVSADC